MKVGDKVVRNISHGNFDYWKLGGMVVTISWIDDEQWVSFEEVGGQWYLPCFHLAHEEFNSIIDAYYNL